MYWHKEFFACLVFMFSVLTPWVPQFSRPSLLPCLPDLPSSPGPCASTPIIMKVRLLSCVFLLRRLGSPFPLPLTFSVLCLRFFFLRVWCTTDPHLYTPFTHHLGILFLAPHPFQNSLCVFLNGMSCRQPSLFPPQDHPSVELSLRSSHSFPDLLSPGYVPRRALLPFSMPTFAPNGLPPVCFVSPHSILAADPHSSVPNFLLFGKVSG